MKAIRFFCGLLAVIPLCLAGPADAEILTVIGKSYCPIKYEINWPFSTDAAKAVAQGSGIAANIYNLPEEKKAEEQSAVAMGSDMERLHILSAPLKVGDKVNEGQILVTYEMPLQNLMNEKQALSKTELDNLVQGLAVLESKLAQYRQQQADLENEASINSVAPITVRLGARDIDALLLQRDYLREKLALAQQRYDNAVTVAQYKYGKDQDLANLPRLGYIRSPSSGYVLWTNFQLVPGMSFTKKASLLTIGRLDPMIVRASVHEIAVQKLKVGDPVSIVFHTIPGQTFRTTISKVDYVAQPAMLQQPSFYQIEMTLPNPDLRIKEGMRCDVTIPLPDAAK